MEELSVVTIYWLLSIGLVIGFVLDLILGKRGMSLAGNLAGGALGAIVIGVIMIYLQLFGALIYAAVGTVALLFLVNVFTLEPEYKPGVGIADRKS